VLARCRLTTRSERFEFASEKSRGFLRGFARIQTVVAFSVAIGADSDADAGRADADAATVPIAALDMTLAAGGISV
jgi:hypothetical protein